LWEEKDATSGTFRLVETMRNVFSLLPREAVAMRGAICGLVCTVGLDGVRADITMMRTPDGHGRVELTRFHTPLAVRAEPESAPANTLGIRRIMFAVEDIDDVVARLRSHGAEVLGEIAQYEDIHRLCFLRGPEGIIIGLAEQLS
jgi:catechol 2,3-dioxygenase-like lactoylglutathione lyase family enzyme